MLPRLSRVLYSQLHRMASTASSQKFTELVVSSHPEFAGADDSVKQEVDKQVDQVDELVKDLSSLDSKLTPLTYLVGNTATTADVKLYTLLHPSVAPQKPEDYYKTPSVTRYFSQIQSLPQLSAARQQYPNDFPIVEFDLDNMPKAERKAPAPKVKKAKAVAAGADKAAGKVAEEGSGIVAGVQSAAAGAAAAVVGAAQAVKDAVVGKAEDAEAAASSAAAPRDGKKKEKKEKKPAAPKKEEPAPSGPLPSMIDLRVGKVLEIMKHPDADSLYVEQIDLGEPTGPRTVCSGLVKYMKEEDILGKSVIVVCNLKPSSMRGVKSHAMLLCASSKDGKDEGGIEFVLPPAGSVPGERVYFEGEQFENATPETQLNPKKKIFEAIQPNFTSLDTLEAAWIDPETKTVHKIRTKDGVCVCPTLKGASLS